MRSILLGIMLCLISSVSWGEPVMWKDLVENPGDGYDLLEEQTITVKFLMKSSGGCFLNFKGELARIL